jgi:hypothetical protein
MGLGRAPMRLLGVLMRPAHAAAGQIAGPPVRA